MIEDILDRKYRLTKSEKYNDFLKRIGVNYLTRKLINNITPVVKITKDGNEYSLHMNSKFKNSVIKFQEGIEFMYQTPDGRTVKSVFDIDDNTITEVQHDGTDLETTIVRTFTPDELKMVMKYDDITATRIYTAIDKD